MNTKSEISASLEDYLETIYIFSEEKQEVRASQIATHLNVKKSSVTEALQNLSKDNFINYRPYSPITLTTKGREAAQRILRKHNIVSAFFKEILNLSEDEATNTACKIEHVISDELASRFGVLHSKLVEETNYQEFLTKLHNSF